MPQLLNYDEALLAVEMTVVKPPFVLDFAAAYLDWPPKFSDEVWDERRAKWADEFGDDWPMVQRILSEFEDMGIYMLETIFFPRALPLHRRRFGRRPSPFRPALRRAHHFTFCGRTTMRSRTPMERTLSTMF